MKAEDQKHDEVHEGRTQQLIAGVHREYQMQAEMKALSRSANIKRAIALYVLGCVLIRFGIVDSLVELLAQKQWRYMPETNFLHSLGEAAFQLIRPFFVALFAPCIIAWSLVLSRDPYVRCGWLILAGFLAWGSFSAWRRNKE